jgi:hypothetical protein
MPPAKDQTPADAAAGDQAAEAPGSQVDEVVTNGTIVPRKSRERFHQYLIQRATIETAANADALADDQINEIFAATTEDQLWDAMKLDGLTALKDMNTGDLLTITGYRLSIGGTEFKTPAYAIVDAYYTLNGMEIKLDTGVERVLGFLRAVESGQVGLSFPVKVKVDKKVTANGTAVTFVKP